MLMPQGGESPDLFLWAERAGETARFQMERKHEEFGCKKLQQGQQHTEHLQNRSPIQYERGKRVQNRFLLVEKGSLWQDEYMTGEQCYPKALRGLFAFRHLFGRESMV